MFYRKIIDKLEEWSQRANRKPLVLRGARQVGKTTLVNLFSKKYIIFFKIRDLDEMSLYRPD